MFHLTQRFFQMFLIKLDVDKISSESYYFLKQAVLVYILILRLTVVVILNNWIILPKLSKL